MLWLQIRQTDGVMGSWEAGLCSADAQGDSWRKGSLEQKGSSPGLSGLWHISLKKPEILSFIICLTTSCKALHAQCLSSGLLGLMPCYWCFDSQAAGVHVPHTAVTGDCTSVTRLQHNCSIYCFSQKVPARKISVKKHSVKMLPALLN